MFSELTAAISQEDGRRGTVVVPQSRFLLLVLRLRRRRGLLRVDREGEDFPAVVVFLDEERATLFQRQSLNNSTVKWSNCLQSTGQHAGPLNFEIGIVLNTEEEDMILVHPN